MFLEEMEQVVPWGKLCALIEPHYPKPGNGRRPASKKGFAKCHRRKLQERATTVRAAATSYIATVPLVDYCLQVCWRFWLLATWLKFVGSSIPG